jgi:hypothetical protein
VKRETRLVALVCLVCLVYLVEPERLDKPEWASLIYPQAVTPGLELEPV